MVSSFSIGYKMTRPNTEIKPSQASWNQYSATAIADEISDDTLHIYCDQAPEVDKETIKKWNQDLDTLLIFVRIPCSVIAMI